MSDISMGNKNSSNVSNARISKRVLSIGLAAILVLSSIVVALPVKNAYAATVDITVSATKFYGPGFVRVLIKDDALTTSGSTITPTIQAIRGSTVLGEVQPTIPAIGTSGQFEFFITTSNDSGASTQLTPRSPLQSNPYIITINDNPLTTSTLTTFTCGCEDVNGNSISPRTHNIYGIKAALKDGDKIKIIYGGKEATIDFASTTATLDVDRNLAGDGNAIILRLRDPDANLDPTMVDEFPEPSGQLTPSGIGVTWKETGANTGIFEATIYVDGPATSPPSPKIVVSSLPSTVEFKIKDFKIYETVTGATDGSSATPPGDNFTAPASTESEDSKTVTIKNSDAKVTLLKDITFANGVQVEIEDPDANVSTEQRETITVNVKVGTSNANITFKETGNNTNKFVPDLSNNRIPIEVGSSTSVSSSKITLNTADIAADVDIEIKYTDNKVDTATGGPPKDFKVLSKLKHTAGTLTSVQDKVPINGKFALRLVDPDLDTGAGQQSYTVDSNGNIKNAADVTVGKLSIVAKNTTLTSIPSGLNIVFIEDPNTPGTFIASNLSMSAINSAVTGGLSDGDLVEIKYKDIMESGQPESIARITIGKPSISIEVDRSSVPIPGNTSADAVKFKVKIIDPLANDNPGSTESIQTSNTTINATHETLTNLKVKYELIDTNNNTVKDNDPTTTAGPITDYIIGADVTFTETGASTGEFEATFSLTRVTTVSNLNNLKFKITYISGSDSVSTSVTFRAFDGSLTTDKSEVRNGTELTITVVDQDGNRDPETVEKLNVTLQGKSDDLTPTTITLDETGPNTGTFSKKIIVGKDVKITDLSTYKFSTRLSIKYTDALASDLTTNVDREQEIRVRTATGNIIVQPEVIGPATKVIIIVDDPDLNANPDGTDTINGGGTIEYLRITSDRSGTTANTDADGKEIGPNEGKFKTVLKLSPLSSANAAGSFTGTGDEIEGKVLPGDIVSIRYTDQKDENGNKRIISVTFQVKSFDGEIVAPDSVKPGDSFTVRVKDPDANRDPDTQDSIRLKITSTTDPVGLEVTALETGANTGEFTASVSTTTGVSAGSLSVKEGDSITIKYTDQFPSDYADRVKQVVDPSRDILFTMQVGTFLPPTERTTVAKPSLRDQAGNVLTQASVDVPVSIASSIKNNTQQPQKFVYIVQVKDADGFVVSISTVGGTLPAGQSFDVSASWTPTAAGTYTVEVFVWTELGKPSPLSKVEAATVRVV